MFSAAEIQRLSDEFETKTPQEILKWAIDTFWPEIALSSSFQTQSVPLLHMASLIRRDILIFFLDTGYHFWETHMFRERLSSPEAQEAFRAFAEKRTPDFTQFLSGASS